MNTWVAAVIAVAAGVVVGQLAGRIVRRVLSRDRQPAAIREVAGSIGGFVFALCLTAGLVTAVGIIDPDQLETMPRGLVNYLPRLIVAGIIVLLGNVAASVLGMVVGRSLQQASGEERPSVVRAVKGVVIGAAVILAVGQLGVDTTIVNLAVAALLFSAGLTFTLLTASGGRDIARNVAAGRYVRRILPVGAELVAPVEGTVVKVHPATVEIRRPDGTTMHVSTAQLLDAPIEFRRTS